MKEKARRIYGLFVDFESGYYRGGKAHYPLTTLSKSILIGLISLLILVGGPYMYWHFNNFERTVTVEAFSLESAFEIAAAKDACGFRAEPGKVNYSVTNSWRDSWTMFKDGDDVVIAQVVEGDFTYQGYSTYLKVVAGPNGPYVEEGDVEGEVAAKFIQVVLEEVPPMNYAKVNTLGGPDPSKLNSPAEVTCRRDFSYDWRTPWN